MDYNLFISWFKDQANTTLSTLQQYSVDSYCFSILYCFVNSSDYTQLTKLAKIHLCGDAP